MKKCLILFISFLTLSCGDIVLETEPIIVNAVDKGTVFRSGDVFNVTFNKSSDNVVVNPTAASIEINYNGESESDSEPLSFFINLKETPEPRFSISDDFKEGSYDLSVTVYEDETIVAEYESDFVVFSGVLQGKVSGVYPLDSLYSESKVILKSDIIWDSYIEPYIIWKNDDEVIDEGYLSDGLDSIIWDTGKNSGFVNIVEELYPFRPVSDSVLSQNSVAFSFTVNPLEKSLYDDLDSYYKVLYFNGNYIDEVNKDLEITYSGTMRPALSDGFYGMIIDSSRGFYTESSIIPADGAEPLSFSVIMDLMPLSENNGIILESSRGDMFITLSVEDGFLRHNFSCNSDSYITDLTPVTVGEGVSLVLTYIKTDSGYNLLYYINGVLAGRESLLFSYQPGDEIYTVVGNGESGSGYYSIVDRLSVYYLDKEGRNNVYPYHLDSREDLGYNYRVLVGFNSIYLPENLEGDGSVDGEYLTMEESSVITYRDLGIGENDFNINVELLEEGKYTLTLFNSFGENVVSAQNGDLFIRRVSGVLFINDSRIENGDISVSGLSLKADSVITVDSIAIASLDKSVASE